MRARSQFIAVTAAWYILAGMLTSCAQDGLTVPEPIPTALAISTHPANSIVSGAVISIHVLVVGENGSTVRTNTTVAIAITPGSGSSGATLGGTLTRSAVNGVASFNDLTIDKAGAGFTLTATASGPNALTPAVTAPFSIVPGAPAKLVFTAQPAALVSLIAGPSIQVAVQDASNNVVTTATTSVTLAITGGTGTSGATLGGTATQPPVNGVATFSDLTVDKAGTGYTLTASGGALTSAPSTAFAVTPGAATRLVFAVQPAGTVAGAAITPAVQVVMQDAAGNTVSDGSKPIAIAIASGTGAAGATLGGTVTGNTGTGAAVFSTLTIDKVATDYKLTASATSLTSATSTSFAITAGSAHRLAFAVQPSAAVSGTAISPVVQVVVQDASGNTVPGAAQSVTVAITSGTGAAGAVLGGTLTRSASAGVAAFSDLAIDKAGSGYTMTASATGLASATSSAFDVSAGAATKVAFGVQPANGTAATALTPAVTVLVQDANGNTETGATSSVTITITAGTGATGAVLGGTLTRSAVDGIATFNDLSIDKASAGYTLGATATGLTAATSGAFAITAGVPSKLALATNAAGAASGAAFSTQPVVAIQDAGGNTVTTDNSVITMTVSGSATVVGTATATATAGVATFTTVGISGKADTTYTLTFAKSGLTSATQSIVPTPGAPSQLSWKVQPPSGSTAGSVLSPAPQVSVQDASGNTVTSATTSITVALVNNSSGAILGGTTTVSAVSGVASFSNLTLDKAGTGYTLGASSGTLTSATSTAFDITSATKLAFVQQPTNTVATQSISPAVTVAVQDVNGNTVTTDGTTQIAIAIGTNAGGGTLSGTTPMTVVNGVATFSNLSIDQVGTDYTLSATSGTLTAATSTAFNITAGSPTAYVTSHSNGSWRLNKIAVATHTVVHTLDDASFGSGLAITPTGAHVYVSGNPVQVVATATNAVVASIGGLGTGAWQSAVTPNGAFVYVAEHFTPGTVSVISTATNTVVATVPVGDHPYGVAVTPNSAFVYVMNTRTSNVSVISTATNTVVATIPVDASPGSVAISPDGTLAYVGHGISSNAKLVTVVSTATNTVVATIAVGGNNAAIAITPDGSFLYVADADHSTVSVIATATNTVVASIPVGSTPSGVAITPDGSFAYVTNYNSTFVSVIATATNTVVASIPVGGQGHGVAIKR